ncbi:MAG TPA: ribonuclease J [Actinomycetes bacterium]|jgi:ribonuclease J|nr:ribonuclease J [Actinomycetes bacterium]
MPGGAAGPGGAGRPGPTRVAFLGGVGEIGRNCTVVEHAGARLLIDCGLAFPDADQPGVDIILPDFSWLADEPERVAGVVLTHAHEDHMGALPYFLRDYDVPVYGTRLSLGMLAAKLEEHELAPSLVEVAAGDRTSLGPFDLEFFAVSHSIPDGVAVAVRTADGVIVHTGDFKMDLTPIDGRPTDLGGLARLAAEGIDLLLADSTNADTPGFIPSEVEVGRVLTDIFETAERRIVVACFASHVHRMQQILDAAAGLGRKVALVGRSMLRNVRVASELGYLRLPHGLLIPVEELTSRHPAETVVLCTGSQGEPFSALTLMAGRDHKWVRIEPGDTVVLSSSLIPGNEAAVYRTVNDLSRQGAVVYHRGNAKVHVSGHAAQGELTLLLSTLRPRHFVPVHGEYRHLAQHAKLAESTGVPRDHVFICEDGDVVELDAGRVRRGHQVPAGVVFVDGLGVGDVGDAVLRDRRKLGGEGFVHIVATIEVQTGKVLAGPDIVTRGFVYEPESGDLIEEARTRVLEVLDKAAAEGVGDPNILKQYMRQTAAALFKERTQRRPVIIPTVMEV